MADREFEVTGLDELKEMMEKAYQEFPDEMNKEMQRAARGWWKSVNEKLTYKESATAHAKAKRPFEKGWKTTYEKNVYGLITDAEVSSTSPHWHLYENGHVEYDFHGQPTGGFVPGYHFAEKTREEYEQKFPDIMEAAAEKVLKNGGLL